MSNTSPNAESESRRTYGKQSHKRSRRRRRKKRFPVILIILILILLMGGAFIGTEVLKRIMPTKERANLQELYGADEGYASAIIDHAWSENPLLWRQEHAYLSYKMIHKELRSRFFWDSTERKLLYTLPTETLSMDETSVWEGTPILAEDQGEVYVLLDFVKEYTDMDVQIGMDPVHVVLTTRWDEEQVSVLSKDTEVRVKGGIKSPIITEVKAGERVTVLEQMENWTKVQTPDGWIGYLTNTAMGPVEKEIPSHTSVEPVYPNLSVDYDICLVWQQSLFNSAKSQLESLLANPEAKASVTTVSPTWFSITGEDGSMSSNASSEYVALAHENGLDVWPVLENVNHTEVSMYALLSSTANRSRLIQRVMSELEQSGADGLNVDLENISEDAGDGYIQLIRELSVECRRRGLILSVDNPVPSAWSSYYNRREQGIVADYVIIMNYDEHYSGSEPGSTASIPYVEDAIVGTLAEVPANKVINGVPFYTRLWKETPTLDSEAISMDGAQEFMQAHNGIPVWDEGLGQNYVRMEEGSCTYQIWLEDDASMDARLKMASGYDLAGTACWKQGMESRSVWSIMNQYYHK